MPGARFCRFEHRTRDVDAARSFYSGLLGEDLWGDRVIVTTIPPRAAALGAPPHWIGHLGVPDVAAAAARFVAVGAEQLGPVYQAADGSPFVVLRDPFQAILAVGAERAPRDPSPVAWHQLHSIDHARSWALYRDLFGWSANESLDLGPLLGESQVFAWEPGGPGVGGISSTVRLPVVHPQWLHFFRVADLESAVARVKREGGLALDVVRLPNGDSAVACDDPQGGAFGLYQAHR